METRVGVPGVSDSRFQETGSKSRHLKDSQILSKGNTEEEASRRGLPGVGGW